jgi:hypothetical protein
MGSDLFEKAADSGGREGIRSRVEGNKRTARGRRHGGRVGSIGRMARGGDRDRVGGRLLRVLMPVTDVGDDRLGGSELLH